MGRIILHVDLDSFYASAEELRNPEIQGKAVVICVYSGRTEDSGAVSTANYKARELGIRAGIPIKAAKKLAEGRDVVFLPTDKKYYSEVSGRVMELMETEADVMEQVSIDEAYLDVTERTGGDWSKARQIAEKIKKKVIKEEGITCSVGVGPNKFIAKMASKHEKPNGLTSIREEEIKSFLANIPVLKLHGIGPKTAEALDEMGIETAGELAASNLIGLREKFGEKKARLLHERSLGIDKSPVEHREKKQLGRIGTLKEDTEEPEIILEKINELSGDLEDRIEREGIRFKTLSIIAVDTTLKTHTKSETIPETDNLETARQTAKKLLERFLKENQGIKLRRVGLQISGLSRRSKQKTLTEF